MIGGAWKRAGENRHIGSYIVVFSSALVTDALVAFPAWLQSSPQAFAAGWSCIS